MNLLQAVNQNNVEVVKEILASTANINVADNHNFTGNKYSLSKIFLHQSASNSSSTSCGSKKEC